MRRDRMLPGLLAVVGLALIHSVSSVAGTRSASDHPDRAQQGAVIKTLTIEDLRAQANADDRSAATLLGYRLFHGLQTPVDQSSALRWWREAAANGDLIAAYNLGLVLERQGERDEAIAYLQIAATGGDMLASFALGTILANDPANPADDAAIRWLQQAAEQGYAPAKYNLAVLLERAQAEPSSRSSDDPAGPPPAHTPTTTALANPDSATRVPRADQQAPDVEPAIYQLPWVTRQNPERYTIQVAAGRSEAGIVRLLERYARDYPRAWFLHRPRSKEPYSAVIGSYENFPSAEQALSGLPQVFRNNAPWIRRFGVLHRELERVAEGLTASEHNSLQPAQ